MIAVRCPAPEQTDMLRPGRPADRHMVKSVDHIIGLLRNLIIIILALRLSTGPLSLAGQDAVEFQRGIFFAQRENGEVRTGIGALRHAE